MEKQPEEITLCKLECVLMSQGEIICQGKTVGWFKDFGPHLEPAAISDDLLAACRELVEVCSYIRDAGNDDDSTLKDAITEGHDAIAKAVKS